MAPLAARLVGFFQSGFASLQDPERYYRNVYSTFSPTEIIRNAIMSIGASVTIAMLQSILSGSVLAAFLLPFAYVIGYGVGIVLATLVIFGIASLLLGSTRTIRETCLWILWSMTLTAPIWLAAQLFSIVPMMGAIVSVVGLLIGTWILFQGLEHYFGLTKMTALIVAAVPTVTALLVFLASFAAMMSLKKDLATATAELRRSELQLNSNLSRAERELQRLEQSLGAAGEGVASAQRALRTKPGKSTTNRYIATATTNRKIQKTSVRSDLATKDGRTNWSLDFSVGKERFKYSVPLKGSQPNAAEARALLKLIQQKRPQLTPVAEAIISNSVSELIAPLQKGIPNLASLQGKPKLKAKRTIQGSGSAQTRNYQFFATENQSIYDVSLNPRAPMPLLKLSTSSLRSGASMEVVRSDSASGGERIAH
jgi:hypothetical protein